MNSLKRLVAANSDLVMVLLVVGVLVVLFAPIPARALDFLILGNISFALLILLLTFYMAKPVEFSTFPSMLLVATLFRLSLNIAATRLILGSGDAGRVIGAVGSYVVAGNYVIGLIVFLILVVVQYVVVTNGAQRVAEVAARFTLDSMPGQQMSIDADLNMGFIDQAEAQRRRKNVSKEAAFYGAMDGASKFVKGDAIAGILILLIDIVGGLVVGVMQQGMRWDDALHTFTLLTIGDGIVTQVPALVISVGTGLLVTRSASDDHLSAEAMRQITAHPKTLLLVIAALFGLMLLPGLPSLPLVVLISVLGIVYFFRRSSAANPIGAHEEPMDTKELDAYEHMAVEPIEVQLGANLAGFIGNDQSLFMDRIGAFRKQFAMESGLVIPSVRFRPGQRLAANAYEIHIHGVMVAHGELHKDLALAVHSSAEAKKLHGVETKEPAYGLRAFWIGEGEKDVARAAQYTLVDPATVFLTHLCEVLRRQSATLLTRKETEVLLGRVRESQPGLVEEIVPTALSVGDVQKLLQNLLRERVCIRNLEAIIETLCDVSKSTKDVAVLTEFVRQRLGAAICQALLTGGNSLHVMTLDPAIEQRLLQGLQGTGEAHAGALIVEPKYAEQVLARLLAQCERMTKKNMMPVLLCAPDLRRHLRALSERLMPHLRVVSLAEIPNTTELRAFGSVTL